MDPYRYPGHLQNLMDWSLARDTIDRQTHKQTDTTKHITVLADVITEVHLRKLYDSTWHAHSSIFKQLKVCYYLECSGSIGPTP